MSEECRVLTKEQYDEMFRRINELEQNLAGAEQSVQEGLEINEELKAENEKLKKKLDIAVKTLKYYDTWFDGRLAHNDSAAIKALKQIKEVK